VLRKAAEGVDDLLLAFVGVLELVHQDSAGVRLPMSAYLVVVREESERPCLQVVEVEGVPLALETAVLRQGAVEEAMQTGDGAGTPLVQGPGKRPLFVHQGSEHGVEVGADALHRFPRSRQRAGVPVLLRPSGGDGGAQGEEGVEEDIPLAGRQRSAGLGPVGQNRPASGLQFVIGLVGLEAGQLVQRSGPGRVLQPLV
jgi:hypothetical protein